ncbi:MAG: hypothetical protein M1541_17585, partial [Acidobacteria bacterium]|nr:hypothetical protein [Acidobacteriota bacterium]
SPLSTLHPSEGIRNNPFVMPPETSVTVVERHDLFGHCLSAERLETGLNAASGFAQGAITEIALRTELPFVEARNTAKRRPRAMQIAS